MKPYYEDKSVTIYQGDVRKVLCELPDESVHCVVTSPPYWGLRDYGCEGQIGLEDSPIKYISAMREVFSEVRRVLRSDGTLWLNMGDSYYRDPGKGDRAEYLGLHKNIADSGCHRASQHRSIPSGMKPKDLVGIPWMLAFALREDGWYLRQDIIWAKPNPMPESVTDRCTKSHEYIFLLSKSERYVFNQEAIKVPLKDTSIARLIQDVESQEGSDRVPGKTNGNMKAVKFGGNKQCPDSRLHSGKEWTPKMAGGGTSYKDGHSGYFSPDGEPLCGIMANKKSVWHVTTQGFAEAHFAVFPEDLIKPCILAGCPEGGTVLDPFMGGGTTGLVARKLHCKAIGIELNPDYIAIAARRLRQEVLDFVAVAGATAPGEEGKEP